MKSLTRYINTILVTLLVVNFNFVSSEGEDFIKLIKYHEGYSPTVYLDMFGHPTIGYGHLLKPGDTYHRITESQATTLLKKDLYAAIILAREIHKDTLNNDQLLAIGHFIYAKGVGNYIRSDLLKAIKANKHKQIIFNEWVGWAYINKKLNLRSLRNRTLEYYTYYGI